MNRATGGVQFMPGRRSRRDELLEVALEAFVRQGYDGTGVAELAASTGMSKAAVNYHFPTKEGLLHALVDPLLDRLDAVVAQHPQHPAWPDGVRALLSDYLEVLSANRPLTRWVDSDTAVLNHPVIGERLRANNRRMHEALTGSATEAEARVRASAALGSLWRPVRNLTDVDVSEHHHALLEAAMAGLESPKAW